MNGLQWAQKIARLFNEVHPGVSAYYKCEQISGYYAQWAYQDNEDGIQSYGDAWKSGNASDFFMEGVNADRNDPRLNVGDEVWFDIGEFDDVVSVVGRDGNRVLVLSTSKSGDRVVDLGNHIYIVHLDTITFPFRGAASTHGANRYRGGMEPYLINQQAAPAPVASGSISDLADAVLRGELGNGEDRRARLGGNYDAVQAEVNRRLEAPAVDIEGMAQAVIRGEFGNGEDRRRNLGGNYDSVQARVNEIVNAQPTVDIEGLAQAVIRGEYGNGQERRDRLGANYDAVQARVNQLV